MQSVLVINLDTIGFLSLPCCWGQLVGTGCFATKKGNFNEYQLSNRVLINKKLMNQQIQD